MNASNASADLVRIQSDRITALEDEVERLRLELSATHDMAATLEADVLRLRAERDWLSKELEHMRVSYSSCDAALAQCEQNSQRIADDLAALRAALDAHNSGCIGACEARAKDCEAYTSRGLQCPECPRDWMVDTEAALAARGKASE